MHELRIKELLGSAPDLRPSGGDDALVVEALAKRYPNGTDAVRGVSFRVRAGEVFGRRSRCRVERCARS